MYNKKVYEVSHQTDLPVRFEAVVVSVILAGANRNDWI